MDAESQQALTSIRRRLQQSESHLLGESNLPAAKIILDECRDKLQRLFGHISIEEYNSLSVILQQLLTICSPATVTPVSSVSAVRSGFSAERLHTGVYFCTLISITLSSILSSTF